MGKDNLPGWVDINIASKLGLLERIAGLRLANNQTERHNPDVGVEGEMVGAGVELALRRLVGAKDELHIEHDGGWDLVYRGKGIDCKGSPWAPGWEHFHLQIPHYVEWVAPYLVFGLFNIERGWARLLGFAPGEWFREIELDKTMPIPCRRLPIAELRPIWELLVI